jgi:hypothetical protein
MTIKKRISQIFKSIKAIVIIFMFFIGWVFLVDSYIPENSNELNFGLFLSSIFDSYKIENGTSIFLPSLIYILCIFLFFLWRKQKNIKPNDNQEVFEKTFNSSFYGNMFLSLLIATVIFFNDFQFLMFASTFAVLFFVLWLVSFMSGDVKTK